MLERVKNFFVRPIASPAIADLYRTCVVQARQPAFYADMHAPDTVEGRFDMLILHVLLVILRLQTHGRETQQLFDIMFADIDRNMRQLGVSDVSIGRKMRPMVAAFYGRAKAYGEALATNDNALAAALRRNVFDDKDDAGDAERLAAYMRAAHEALAAQTTEDILGGQLSFPAAA